MSDNLEKPKGVGEPLLKELKRNQTNNGSDTYSGSYALGAVFTIYLESIMMY